LLVLTDGGHEEPMEFFPVDRSFLAAIMCMRGVEFRRVTEEEYQKFRNSEPTLNPHMAAA
jgi:hypothetical protein